MATATSSTPMPRAATAVGSATAMASLTAASSSKMATMAAMVMVSENRLRADASLILMRRQFGRPGASSPRASPAMVLTTKVPMLSAWAMFCSQKGMKSAKLSVPRAACTSSVGMAMVTKATHKANKACFSRVGLASG